MGLLGGSIRHGRPRSGQHKNEHRYTTHGATICGLGQSKQIQARFWRRMLPESSLQANGDIETRQIAEAGTQLEAQAKFCRLQTSKYIRMIHTNV